MIHFDRWLLVCGCQHGRRCPPRRWTNAAAAASRQTDRGASLLRAPGRRLQSISSRRRACGALEQYQEANDQFRGADQAGARKSVDTVSAGDCSSWSASTPDEAVALSTKRWRSIRTTPRPIWDWLGSCRRFRRQGRRIRREGRRAGSEACGSRTSCSLIWRSKTTTKASRQRSRQGAGYICRSAGRPGIHATIDWLDDKADTPRLENPWIERLLKINPVYGEATPPPDISSSSIAAMTKGSRTTAKRSN